MNATDRIRAHVTGAHSTAPDPFCAVCQHVAIVQRPTLAGTIRARRELRDTAALALARAFHSPIVDDRAPAPFLAPLNGSSSAVFVAPWARRALSRTLPAVDRTGTIRTAGTR